MVQHGLDLQVTLLIPILLEHLVEIALVLGSYSLLKWSRSP